MYILIHDNGYIKKISYIFYRQGELYIYKLLNLKIKIRNNYYNMLYIIIYLMVAKVVVVVL